MKNPFRRFLASSRPDTDFKLFKKTELIANLDVPYIILELHEPAEVCGFIDISNLTGGDRIEVSLLTKAEDKDFRPLRSIILAGPPSEPWLQVEEHFYPNLQVTLNQKSGIAGRKFRAFFYKR